MELTHIDVRTDVKISLTAKQCEYLHQGPSADGVVGPQGDLVIHAYDSEGWILVGNGDPESLGQVDGSGVWVDTEGIEHYG